jgi:hypothetical protein
MAWWQVAAPLYTQSMVQHLPTQMFRDFTKLQQQGAAVTLLPARARCVMLLS